MKSAVVVLLFFISRGGWIAFNILALYKTVPDKWYIVLTSFTVAAVWGFFMQGVAQRYRDKK